VTELRVLIGNWMNWHRTVLCTKNNSSFTFLWFQNSSASGLCTLCHNIIALNLGSAIYKVRRTSIKLWAVKCMENITLRLDKTLCGTRNTVSALGTTEEKTVSKLSWILWYTSVPELNLPLSAKFASRSHILCVHYVRLYFLLQSADQYWIGVQRCAAYDYAVCLNAWCPIISVGTTYGCYPPPTVVSSSFVLKIVASLHQCPLKLIYCSSVKRQTFDKKAY
jgi:hypothetical protein